MSHPDPAHPASGFALVEALASLAVLAMMAMLLMQGVGSGRQVGDRLEARTQAGETVEAAQDALRDRVAHMVLLTQTDASVPYSDFDGGADRLVFSALPAPRDGSSLRRYTLRLDAGGRVVLSSVGSLETPAGQHPRSVVLLQGVRALDLAYFGAAAPDYRPRWRSAWTAEAAAPRLIRARVAFADGDRRSWPDLLAAPSVNIDSDCILDRALGRCRGRS